MREMHVHGEDIGRFRRGEMPPAEVLAFSAHLAQCAECAELALAQVDDAAVRALHASLTDALDEHTAPEDLDRFVDGLMSVDARDAVEAHLDICARCREDVEDLRAVARTTAVHGRRRVRHITPLRVATLAATLAAAVIGTMLVLPPPPQAPGSIAVLPLRNASSDGRDSFLSVGIADALASRLRQVELPIRPTSAVLAFRSFGDAQKAGESLKVDRVIEGSFSVIGGLVRVNVQLTDPRTGRAVWSDSIDGSRGDLLRLVDEVTARTTSRLGKNGHESQASPIRSKSPEAYEEFLKARALNGTLIAGEYAAQIGSLEKAIALDPEFAAAHADLAISLSLGIARGLISAPDTVDRAEAHARTAVRLDPNLAEAHQALARFLVRRHGRYREAVRELLAAARLEPTDTTTLSALITHAIYSGDLAKAHCLTKRLVEIDPTSYDARVRGYHGITSLEPKRSLRDSQFALSTRETELAGHDMRGLAFVMMGRLDDARREVEAARRIAPAHYIPNSLDAMIAAAANDPQSTRAFLATFEREARRNHWAAIRVAQCYARLGDHRAAIEWIDRAIDTGHHNWYGLRKHPWFRSLHRDPEFMRITNELKADLDDVKDDVEGVSRLICD